MPAGAGVPGAGYDEHGDRPRCPDAPRGPDTTRTSDRHDGERRGDRAIEVVRLDAGTRPESRSSTAAAARVSDLEVMRIDARLVLPESSAPCLTRCRSRLGRDARPSPVPHPLRRRRDRGRRARRRRISPRSTPPTARRRAAGRGDPLQSRRSAPVRGRLGPRGSAAGGPVPRPVAGGDRQPATARGLLRVLQRHRDQPRRADRPAADADRARALPDPGRDAGQPRARRSRRQTAARSARISPPTG